MTINSVTRAVWSLKTLIILVFDISEHASSRHETTKRAAGPSIFRPIIFRLIRFSGGAREQKSTKSENPVGLSSSLECCFADFPLLHLRLTRWTPDPSCVVGQWCQRQFSLTALLRVSCTCCPSKVRDSPRFPCMEYSDVFRALQKYVPGGV